MAGMDEGVVPSEGIGSAGAASGGKVSYLDADWINARVANVIDRLDGLLKRTFSDGIMGSGYPPFESPVTDEMLMRMSPDQFRAFYDSIPSLGERAKLYARMSNLKLPPREMMPFERPAQYPLPRGFIQAGREPDASVESSASV